MTQWMRLPSRRGYTLEHIKTHIPTYPVCPWVHCFPCSCLLDLSLAPLWWFPTCLLALLAYLTLAPALALGFLALALKMAVALLSSYLVNLGLSNGDERDVSRWFGGLGFLLCLRWVSSSTCYKMIRTLESCSWRYEYSWTGRWLHFGLTLAFLLSLSDYKSQISFGFLSPNYTRRVVFWLSIK